MKKNNLLLITALILLVLFGKGLTIALADTSPSLGSAIEYAILSDTYTNTVSGTTINGSIGFSTGPAVLPAGIHASYGSGSPYATAGSDQSTALASLNSQACTFTFASGAVDLSTDTTHGLIGVYTPGVYCIDGAASVGTAGITLSGSGTYIFRMTGALDTVANSVVSLNSASACDVWWTPGAATTLGADSTFVGNNIDASGITLGNNANWVGRALAFGGTVTTVLNNTITAPDCSLINDDDDDDDISSGGSSPLVERVQPIISITKTPSQFTLSNGPGVVTYVYTVFNRGTVAMRDIKVVDDKCLNVAFVSGDNNNNLILETDEVWTFKCESYLAQTTKNIATVVGYDYGGLSATDVTSATVVVIQTLAPISDDSVTSDNATTTLVNDSEITTSSIPKLPNTGAGGESNSKILWYIVGGGGVFGALLLVYLVRYKHFN